MTRQAILRQAYNRGFEKAAQEAAPLFGTDDTSQLEDREGFGKRRAPGMLYYDKDPTTKEYTVPTLPFGLQIPTNDAPRRAAVSNSLVRAGTPAESVTGIFEGRAPVNRSHMRSAVVDSLNNEFTPRAASLVTNWGELPRDIQQRVARDVMYPGAWSPEAIGHLGTNGFAQAADEFELNDFPPKTKQYVAELATRLRAHAANTAGPAPAAPPPTTPQPASPARTQTDRRAYTIESGETLSAVARKLGIPLNYLLQYNPTITDPNRIRAGQQIVVPTP